MKKVRQISAIVGIVILLGLYVVTLIAAITASEYAHGLFFASLFASLVIPVMIYVITRLYKRTHEEGSMTLHQARKMAKEMGKEGAEEKFMAAGGESELETVEETKAQNEPEA